MPPHTPRDRASEMPAALDLSVFRQMADMSSEAFYLTDAQGRYRYINEAAATLTGYSREELLGMTLFDLDPEFPREQFGAIVEALVHGPLPAFEARTRRKDGTYHPSEASVARIDVNGEAYLFGVVRDVSQRKQVEAAQRTFAQRMLQTLEAERQRVARELHDDVGQAVAAVGVVLRSLEHGTDAVPEEARPALAATHAAIRQITESVARLVRDYQPAELVGLGFEETVRAHAEQFALRHRMSLRLATAPVDGLLTPEHELHVYRIVQEALANVARHARARRVLLRVLGGRRHVTVSIRDDGIGFDVGRFGTTGRFGLITMRERAELMGATLVLRSRAGRGTEVRVVVPVSAATDAAPRRAPRDRIRSAERAAGAGRSTRRRRASRRRS